MIVAVPDGWRSQVDDRVIPAELLLKTCAHGRPHRFLLGPVRNAIDGAAVAQDNRRTLCFDRYFQFALYIEDSPLRSFAEADTLTTWKSAAEDDTRRLRQHLDVNTERLADELQNCGLAASRTTGQDDSPRFVEIQAFAVSHHPPCQSEPWRSTPLAIERSTFQCSPAKLRRMVGRRENADARFAAPEEPSAFSEGETALFRALLVNSPDFRVVAVLRGRFIVRFEPLSLALSLHQMFWTT